MEMRRLDLMILAASAGDELHLTFCLQDPCDFLEDNELLILESLKLSLPCPSQIKTEEMTTVERLKIEIDSYINDFSKLTLSSYDVISRVFILDLACVEIEEIKKFCSEGMKKETYIIEAKYAGEKYKELINYYKSRVKGSPIYNTQSPLGIEVFLVPNEGKVDVFFKLGVLTNNFLIDTYAKLYDRYNCPKLSLDEGPEKTREDLRALIEEPPSLAADILFHRHKLAGLGEVHIRTESRELAEMLISVLQDFQNKQNSYFGIVDLFRSTDVIHTKRTENISFF